MNNHPKCMLSRCTNINVKPRSPIPNNFLRETLGSSNTQISPGGSESSEEVPELHAWNEQSLYDARGTFGHFYKLWQSPWVCRVKKHFIKNRSFWGAKIPGEWSWNWRKHNFMFIHGSDCNWLVESGYWTNIRTRTPHFNPTPSGKDIVYWCFNRSGKFTIRSAAQIGREESQKVEWHKLVWARGAAPRHSFILWLAVYRKLLTQDRLKQMGVSMASRCPLCRCDEEAPDHLFFRCSFSQKIRFLLRDKGSILRADRSWEDLIKWLSKESNSNSLTCIYGT